MLDQLARRNELPPSIIPELRSVYASEQPVMSWQILGPFAGASVPTLPPDRAPDPKASVPGAGGKRIGWKTVHAKEPHGSINLAAHLYRR